MTTTQEDQDTNAPENYPNKNYLGDGAYVQQGAHLGEVILTTEDGISVQNRVVLGPSEVFALTRWLESIRKVNAAWEEARTDD